MRSPPSSAQNLPGDFSFLAISGSARFLLVKGPLSLKLLKDPPLRVPAVMSRTASTTSESVEIRLFRVLNTGTQESKVKLGSLEQAATRARQKDREKGKVIIGIPFHIVLNLATSTRKMEINERWENEELGVKREASKLQA